MANAIEVVERLRCGVVFTGDSPAEIDEAATDNLMDEAADTIERLRAELAAKVPEGHVVVPVEPTETMVDAVMNGEWGSLEDELRKAKANGYRAMIEASERERAMDELIAMSADEYTTAGEGEHGE